MVDLQPYTELIRILDRDTITTKQLSIITSDVLAGNVPESVIFEIIRKYKDSRIGRNAQTVLNNVDFIKNIVKFK